MMQFEHPAVLLAILPWLVLCRVLLNRQLRAMDWLQERTSGRRRQTLNRTSESGLKRRFIAIAVMGAAIIVAASAPWRPAELELEVERRVIVLVFDGSLSMGAYDAAPHPLGLEDVEDRFDQAKQMAMELLEDRDDDSFAVLSFSGGSVIHLPPTRDRLALEVVIPTLDYHVYSQSNGTRFSSAFDAVLHLLSGDLDAVQVVLLSDGELPRADEWEEPLDLLARRGVPVHTVGFGSTEYQSMSAFDIRDLIAGVEEKRVALSYETRRESEVMEAIADRTDGEALVVEDGEWVKELSKAIDGRPGGRALLHERGRKDLSTVPILFAFLLWLAEILLWQRPPIDRIDGPRPWSKQWRTTVLLIGLLTLPGCRFPGFLEAHLANKRGMDHHLYQDHAEARKYFERARSYGFREHVPIYNLGNLSRDDEDYAGAHELYERAIAAEPDYLPAWFNDGHALFDWALVELDPESCRFDRPRSLLEGALERFTHVAENAGPSLIWAASTDEKAVRDLLAELDAMEEACQQPPPPTDGNPPPPPPEGEGEDDQPPPPPPPLSDEERREISKAMRRVKSSAASAGSFHHSELSQRRPEEAEAAGESDDPIWW